MARGQRPPDRINARDLLVLEHLRREKRPLTAYDLIDALGDRGISAPPTVYRVLARLTARGLVHRLQSLNAFVACAHSGHAGVPVFTICERCGAVAELDDKAIAAELTQVTERATFSVSQAAVEVTGRCADCAGRDSPGGAGRA